MAFQRLHLAAGATQRITLAVPLRACATFDLAQDGFVTKGGLHRLVVARHVEDDGQAVAVALALELELEAALVCR